MVLLIPSPMHLLGVPEVPQAGERVADLLAVHVPGALAHLRSQRRDERHDLCPPRSAGLDRPDFGGLVLDCIKVKLCNQICV